MVHYNTVTIVRARKLPMFDSFITTSFPLFSNLRHRCDHISYILYRPQRYDMPDRWNCCLLTFFLVFHKHSSFWLLFLVFLYSSSILITQKNCISIHYSITFWYRSIALYSSFSTPLPLAWQKLRLHCPIPIITSPSLNLLFFSMTLFYYELNKKQQVSKNLLL